MDCLGYAKVFPPTCVVHLGHGPVSLEEDLRETGSYMLNVRYQNLYALPNSIADLDPLDVLKVSGNSIENLPEWLTDLPNLHTITMCDMKHLESLIAQLAGMDLHLSCLDLGNNSLPSIPERVFQMKSLLTLMVRNNQLVVLSERIGQLISLKKLQVDRNKLQTLGAAILQVKQTLEELHASQNPFLAFPHEICQLTRLKVLNLFSCQFKHIPLEISNLQVLQSLSLEMNNLREFPLAVVWLQRLEKLTLAKNGIQNVPDDIEKLTEVKELDLSENELTVLNPKLLSLRKLEALSLAHNKIVEISHLETMSNSVRCIDLSSNFIVELPVTLSAEFMKSHSLETVCVDDNPMCKPPLRVCMQGLQSIAGFNDALSQKGEVEGGYVSILTFGESEAGKTSAVRSVMENKPITTAAGDRTLCLDLHKWHPDELPHCTVVISDLGGHSAYDITTPIFVTDNSLCLVTFDLSTYKSENFEKAIGQWVKKIYSLVRNARMMVVGTHSDLCPSVPGTLDYTCQEIMRELEHMIKSYEDRLENELSKAERDSQQLGRQCIHFGYEPPALSSRIATLKSVIASIRNTILVNKDVIQVSCKDSKDVHDLRRYIVHTIQDTLLFPTLKTTVPSFWVSLEVEMFKLCQDNLLAITLNEYYQLAKDKAHVTKDKALEALEYFHNTRVALCYDRSGLRHQVIIDPGKFIKGFREIFRHDLKRSLECWMTTTDSKRKLDSLGVSYESLKQGMSQLCKGKLNQDVLRVLWADTGLQTKHITFMVSLLEQCNLAVPLSDDMPQSSLGYQLLIPWLASGHEPDIVSGFTTQCQGLCHTVLRIVFPDFMPPSLFAMIAARCYTVMGGNRRFYWENGFFIESVSGYLKVHVPVVTHECSSAIVFEAWAVDVERLWLTLLPGLLETEILFKQWNGLWVERWVVCPHCLNDKRLRETGNMTLFHGDWLNPELVSRQKYYGCPNIKGQLIADSQIMVPSIGKI